MEKIIKNFKEYTWVYLKLEIKSCDGKYLSIKTCWFFLGELETEFKNLIGTKNI